MSDHLSKSEQQHLLKIARQGMSSAVHCKPLPKIPLEDLPVTLQRDGASFVTLTINGLLRGCIGTLDAYRPLAFDVQEHAVAAALHDFRFPPVKPAELSIITIEVSVLTPTTRLFYDCPDDLVEKLRPKIDGVILENGEKKATFLPQVWEKIPDQTQFLAQLCMKMGAPSDLWRCKPVNIYIYQVQEFSEKKK